MKTLWHSEIQQPLRVKVTSDALESRYKKSGEAGHFYVKLEVNGEERSYAAENLECAQALGSMKGEGEITIKGEGRGADDARIIVMGTTEQERRLPERTIVAESREHQRLEVPHSGRDPLELCEEELIRVLNLFWLIEKGVQTEVEQSQVSGVDPALCTPENFGGKCGSAFRHLDAKGFVAKMPAAPLWGAANKMMRAEAGRLADKLRDEGALGHS